MAVKDWSTTANSNVTDNGPTGGTGIAGVNNISNFDNALRSIMAQIASQMGKVGFKGADMASAATVNLANATGFYVDITGTTTITALGTVDAGQIFVLKFEGTAAITHNATSLILPGGKNMSTRNGDIFIMMSEGSGNWRCINFQRASDIVLYDTWTPTFAGFGTVASVTAAYLVSNGVMSVWVNFTTGTVQASAASMTIPSGWVIDLPGFVVGTGYRDGNDLHTTILTSSGDTGKLFFGAVSGSTNGLTPGNGNAIAGSTQAIKFYAQFPVNPS